MADATRSTESGWRDFEIPGGTVPVSLERLAVDRQSLTSQSLLRFPSGWARSEAGWYSVDEEFLVLEGALHMSAVTYRAGDYALVPAGFLRFASMTPGGALILTWFSGSAEWTKDAGHGPGYDSNRLVQATWANLPEEAGPIGAGRKLREEAELSSWILSGDVAATAPQAVDLFSIPDHTWSQAAPGDPVPSLSPPVFARAWSQ